jgi:hypothetical protein
MYIFIRAEFTPKLFLPEKNTSRVYNSPIIMYMKLAENTMQTAERFSTGFRLDSYTIIIIIMIIYD